MIKAFNKLTGGILSFSNPRIQERPPLQVFLQMVPNIMTNADDIKVQGYVYSSLDELWRKLQPYVSEGDWSKILELHGSGFEAYKDIFQSNEYQAGVNDPYEVTITIEGSEEQVPLKFKIYSLPNLFKQIKHNDLVLEDKDGYYYEGVMLGHEYLHAAPRLDDQSTKVTITISKQAVEQFS